MLESMFSGRHVQTPEDTGAHFIDRDATHFRHVLNFLRDPLGYEVTLSGKELQEFKVELDYYGLLQAVFNGSNPTRPLPSWPPLLKTPPRFCGTIPNSEYFKE